MTSIVSNPQPRPLPPCSLQEAEGKALKATEESFEEVAGEFFRTALHPWEARSEVDRDKDLAVSEAVQHRLVELKEDFRDKFAHCPVKMPDMLQGMPIPQPVEPTGPRAPGKPVDFLEKFPTITIQEFQD
jgi:hypothetical protein